jgi:hypothetical protein
MRQGDLNQQPVRSKAYLPQGKAVASGEEMLVGAAKEV